jgi:hypothetical protein
VNDSVESAQKEERLVKEEIAEKEAAPYTHRQVMTDSLSI